MKIIETRAAPNPRRVRIYLAEKGLSVPFEERSLVERALKTPEFTALNPLQRVPILVLDDGTVITETMAICRYFEELHPEPALMGMGALGRATVEMWNRRAELNLFFHVAQVFRHTHPRMEGLEVPQVPEWGHSNRVKALHVLEVFNQRLSQSRYLAGDTYSVADITALVAVDFMKPAKIERPATLLHLNRWHAEVAARPSATA